MIVLGITGSIGMGKSTVTSFLKEQNIPVHESDNCVHELLANDSQLISQISQAFPNAIENGLVNRQKLGEQVFANQAAMKTLESLVHPKVKKSQQDFLAQHRKNSAAIVGLDIPLLFEGGYEKLCNYVIVVTCNKTLQQSRVLKRPGVTLERFKQIQAMQLPTEAKIAKADFVIQTDVEPESTLQALKEVLKEIVS